MLLVAVAPAAAEFGFVGTLGSAGPGDGQFFNARGLAVDGAGNLVVAEDGNDRIQVVQPDGTFVRTWGTPGAGNGQFAQLWDVAVGEAGNVYTAESDFGSASSPDRIQKFDPVGNFLDSWSFAGPGTVFAIAADAAGNIYVALWDHSGGKVEKFDPAGTSVHSWGTPGFGPGQFRNLTGITVDGAGDVYTLEGPSAPDPNQSNLRVQKFDAMGNPLNDFAGGVSSFPIGEGDGQAIDVDAAGNVYVAGASGVVKFGPTGALLSRDDTCQLDIRGAAAHLNGNIYTGAGSSLIVFGEGGTPCGEAPVNLSFSGQEGVSVNDAARFTNDPDVTLSIVAPGGATRVLLSNDGGFLEPAVRDIEQSGEYPWALDSDPDVDERLPKTVYVRFGNDTVTSAQTFTDDIILDTVPPVVQSATLQGGGGSAASVAAKAKRKFKILIKARDKNSGVKKVQFARKKGSKKGRKTLAFKRKVTLKAKRAPRYVRAIDRAGNRSKWRKIKRR